MVHFGLKRMRAAVPEIAEAGEVASQLREWQPREIRRRVRRNLRRPDCMQLRRRRCSSERLVAGRDQVIVHAPNQPAHIGAEIGGPGGGPPADFPLYSVFHCWMRGCCRSKGTQLPEVRPLSAFSSPPLMRTECRARIPASPASGAAAVVRRVNPTWKELVASVAHTLRRRSRVEETVAAPDHHFVR